MGFLNNRDRAYSCNIFAPRLRHTAADIAGLIGWLVGYPIGSLVVFHTPLQVILTASLAGLVSSLLIALVVATSIFQVSLFIISLIITGICALMTLFWAFG
jgi:lactate permease